MTSIDQFLTSAKSRLAAATPGPWVLERCASVENWWAIGNPDHEIASGPMWSNDQGPLAKKSFADFEFIASAPTDLAKALAVIECMREALKDIRSYSLGSKADTCDEALAEAERIVGE